jgi:hypothetical protein
MNIDMKALRQIFVSGAIGTGFGYIAALKLGSWLYCPLGAFAAVLLCDIRLTLEMFFSAVTLLLTGIARAKYFPGFLGKMFGVSLKRLGAVVGYLWSAAQIILPILLVTCLLALFDIKIGDPLKLKSQNSFYVMCICMLFVEVFGAALLFVALCFFPLLSRIGGEALRETKTAYIGILSKRLLGWMPGMTRTIEKAIGSSSKPGIVMPLWVYGSLFPFVGLLAAWYLLLDVIVSLIIFFDLCLMVIFGVSVTKSLSAGLGALVASLIEVAHFPTMELTLTSLIRFAIFMVLGGLIGIGVFLLRKKIEESAEKITPQVVVG